MEIYCKSTKRFLMNVDIEKYNKSIEVFTKTNITLPLIIEIPCRSCRMIEVYEIYPTHYIHVKSYKRDLTLEK